MSGAGKSTLLVELSRRGLTTVDTDYGEWVTAGALWGVERMDELLAGQSDGVVARESNPYGRTAEQQAEIRRHALEVEPLLRRRATLVLDGRRPVDELVDAIEALG